MEATTIPWNPREHLLFANYKTQTHKPKNNPSHPFYLDLSKVDPELNLSFHKVRRGWVAGGGKKKKKKKKNTTKSAPTGLRNKGKCIFSKKAEPRKTKGNMVGKARYKAKMFPPGPHGGCSIQSVSFEKALSDIPRPLFL